MNGTKLVFVYNARSGKLNSILDAGHKIISPDTYQCKLCQLTYGPLKERKSWAAFRKSNIASMVFFHADEFKKAYRSKFGYKFDFPVILIENKGDLEVFIDKKHLNSMESTAVLIKAIEERLHHINEKQ